MNKNLADMTERVLIVIVLVAAMSSCREGRTTSLRAKGEVIGASMDALPSGLTQKGTARCLQFTVTGHDAPDGPRYMTKIGFFEREGDGVRLNDEGIQNNRPEPIYLFTRATIFSGGKYYEGSAVEGEGTTSPGRVMPRKIDPGQSWNGSWPVNEEETLEHLYQLPGLASCSISLTEASPDEVRNGQPLP